MPDTSNPHTTRIQLTLCPEQPCAYFPDRLSQVQAFQAKEVSPEIYHQLMDRGFRRSGQIFYQPVCQGCRACIPIRVPVAEFTPSRSQRRAWRRNADLRVTESKPAPTDEKYALFQRYQTQWHAGKMDNGPEAFADFLYRSPVDTVEFEYREPSGKLLGAGICDVSQSALSAVYFYFDPDHRQRSLGTFSALFEIESARARQISYYYLGYWIDGCRTMQYKVDYRPHELLVSSDVWQRNPV